MRELDGLSIHHIGFAVRDMDSTQSAYEILGACFFHESADPERNLSFRFGRFGDYLIELVSPIDHEKECAVTNMVSKSPCTPYHICFETDNLDEEIKRLREIGLRRIGKIISSDLYGYDSKGVFMYGDKTGLIELIERVDNAEKN